MKCGDNLEDYFTETKRTLEEAIPGYGSGDFSKMGNRIRAELKKKESEGFLLRRSLKILVLGDWSTRAKRKKLDDIKEALLRNGVYAKTIDSYYDTQKEGGLSPVQILETCCVLHQLIVFVDGEGPGTLTEQNYLSPRYEFHGKIIFFIEKSKFDRFKGNPSSYIRSFPTIIPYTASELSSEVLIFSRLRIYRLSDIIAEQKKRGKGLKRQGYQTWRQRLGKRN